MSGGRGEEGGDGTGYARGLGSARGQGEREGRRKCIVKEGQISVQACGIYCQSGQHWVHDQAKDFHAHVQTDDVPVASMYSVSRRAGGNTRGVYLCVDSRLSACVETAAIVCVSRCKGQP